MPFGVFPRDRGPCCPGITSPTTGVCARVSKLNATAHHFARVQGQSAQPRGLSVGCLTCDIFSRLPSSTKSFACLRFRLHYCVVYYGQTLLPRTIFSSGRRPSVRRGTTSFFTISSLRSRRSGGTRPWQPGSRAIPAALGLRTARRASWQASPPPEKSVFRRRC